MEKILILGAYGATAQIVIQRLIKETHLQLRLYLPMVRSHAFL